MKQIYLILLLVSICFCKGWTQRSELADSTIVFAGSQTHYGKILAHSRSVADFTDVSLAGFQVDISRIRYTQTSWNTCNCYSQNGISLSYFDFNNGRELGKSLSFAVFAEPQLTYGRINLGFRAGAGISYLTRTYHPDKNPRNLFFSTPWSGLLLVQLTGRYRLSKSWFMRMGASYHHISNGGKRQPNLGMNFPTLTLGAEYSARYHTFERRRKNSINDKSLQYYAGLSYNTRSVDESDFRSTDRKIVIGMLAGLYKPVARMHGIGAGFEFFHDGALKERARQTVPSYDHRVFSGLIRHHFLFGRFDFSQSLGIYLQKEYPTPEKIFQRYAIQYRIFEQFEAGLSLKAHLYVAEQMDVRIGFLF